MEPNIPKQVPLDPSFEKQRRDDLAESLSGLSVPELELVVQNLGKERRNDLLDAVLPQGLDERIHLLQAIIKHTLEKKYKKLVFGRRRVSVENLEKQLIELAGKKMDNSFKLDIAKAISFWCSHFKPSHCRV